MDARWLFVLTALLVPVFAGCGQTPSAKFVLSDRTKKLAPAARAAVDSELQKNFGDPNHLVVWQKLPVDFGAFDGVVIEAAGQSVTDSIRVQLRHKADSKVPLEPNRINGAGIVWESGANSDVVAEDSKGRPLQIDFQVAHFDPQTSTLKMRVLPPAAIGALSSPKSGDKFTLLGPALQYGHKLYMTHCLHCHGVSGDGNGPTAAYFDVKPRDYRQGLFKFTSTRNPDKARRDDLSRTVRLGIPGTYMPSFLLFSDEELGAIVEYVRWLSMRGEFEQKMNIEFDSEGYTSEAIAQRVKGGESQDQVNAALAKYVSSELPGKVGGMADEISSTWNTAEQPESVVVPKKTRTADDPESRKRGRELFLSATAKCAQCHGPAGRGDGPQTEDYQNIPLSTKKYPEPGLYDAWDHKIKPRDLTAGIYRGGRRPVDIYRRISSGIKGTPMPPFGQALNDDQIWDLVNYVMSLPYQKGLEQPEHNVQQSKIASATLRGLDGGRAD